MAIAVSGPIILDHSAIIADVDRTLLRVGRMEIMSTPQIQTTGPSREECSNTVRGRIISPSTTGCSETSASDESRTHWSPWKRTAPRSVEFWRDAERSIQNEDVWQA